MIRVFGGADYEQMSRLAADAIAKEIRAKPNLTMIVATGNTPTCAYEMLIDLHAAGSLNCGQVRLFQLDEYVGVGPDDPRSLYRWTLENFARPLGITDVTRLAGDAQDLEAEAARYSAAVAEAGGIDLCVLGVGPNGHLGYNEPPCSADAPTRVVDLTESSLTTAASAWKGQYPVPPQAITCGMDILLAAKRILLMVSGGLKADIFRRVLEEPGNDDVPASHLHGAQDRVTILADAACFRR